MFSVSPLEFRFSLDDPLSDNFNHAFSITNLSDSPLSLHIYAAPPSSLTNSAFGYLAAWLTFSDPNPALAPGESKTFSFSISPTTLPISGNQYANLYIESVPADTSTPPSPGITILSRVAIPLYGIANSQENHRKAELSSFTISAPITFSRLAASTTFSNTGNIDFSTSASFSVSSLFGKNLYETSSFVNVLPSEQKTIFSEWTNTPPLGFYRLEYSLKAADLDITASRIVTVISPLALLIFVLFVLCTLTFYIHFTKQRRS